MNIVNKTPHALVVRPAAGDDIVFAPVAPPARVATTAVVGEPIDGIPVARTVWGEVENLPAPSADTVYLVSALVLARVPERAGVDVFAPDTGATAIRVADGPKKGQIEAVRGFTC